MCGPRSLSSNGRFKTQCLENVSSITNTARHQNLALAKKKQNKKQLAGFHCTIPPHKFQSNDCQNPGKNNTRSTDDVAKLQTSRYINTVQRPTNSTWCEY